MYLKKSERLAKSPVVALGILYVCFFSSSIQLEANDIDKKCGKHTLHFVCKMQNSVKTNKYRKVPNVQDIEERHSASS